MRHFSRLLLLACTASACLLVVARPPNIFELDALKRTPEGGFDPLGLEELTMLNKNVKGADAIRQPPRAIPTEPQADGPIAQTQYGAVQGYLDDGVNTWRGVPYAAPPTGEYRLREPQDALSWNGTLQTYSQAQICPQIHIFDWLYLGDEDCLYADVYAPVDATPSNPKPVFVWIFGGGWVIGDGYEFGWYDGHNVAKARDHVIVTFNYRLGPLGFMANDALRADNPNNYAGNWGLLDQVKVLEWVQKNIAQFGGDPTRVTIGGESAGAFSTCWHLASPLSKGLFHAAVLESGTCDSEPFFVDWQNSRNWTNTYIGMVGCNPDASDVLTCIRNLPTGVIMGNILSQSGARVNETITSLHAAHAAAQLNTQWGYKPLLFPLMSWGATVDGVSLLDVPLNQIQSGQYNNVPVIMGTNNDEGTLFTPSFPIVCPGVHYPIQNGDIAIALSHVFSGNSTMVDMVLANYPIQDFQNAGDCLNQLFRDFMFVCPTHRALKSMTAQGANTWMYHWDYHGHWIDDLILGDYHTAELTFVWDNQWPLIVHAFDQDDYTMADSVDTYWSNLVWYLNPNGNGTSSQEYWPAYDPVNQADMILAVPTQVEQNYKQSQCVFWDSIDAWNRVKGNVPTKTAPSAKSAPAQPKKPKIVLTEQ